VKLALSPFPFAYAQTCDGLLLIHWLIVPVVTSQWATHAVWAALFSFVQVFVLSLLNSIAGELANPFGPDTNDVDGAAMQVDMNQLLCMLLEPGSDRAPTMFGGWGDAGDAEAVDSRKSLSKVFRGGTADFCTTPSGRTCGAQAARRAGSLRSPLRRLSRGWGTPSASIPPSKPQPPDDAPDPDVVGDERLPLPICPGRLDLGRALWRPGFDADDRVPTGSTAESGGVEPEFGMDAAEAGADGCEPQARPSDTVAEDHTSWLGLAAGGECGHVAARACV